MTTQRSDFTRRIGYDTARHDAGMEQNDQGRSSWLAEWKLRLKLASLRG